MTTLSTEDRHHIAKSVRQQRREEKLAKGRKGRPSALPDVIYGTSNPWPRPYHIEDNLRRVKPYHFTYNTWCKERWRKRPLLEVFADEFRDRPVAYYETAIRSGYIQINGIPITDPDYILKNGDLLSHTLHRHEPPVTSERIGVVYESPDMLVIHKPASIPVHPAGRYNYNSIVEILRSERGPHFDPLPCNRLDRLTSGIMFIAKSSAAAERMTTQLMARTVRKEYVARVAGEFPEGEVRCDQPVLQISPKLGLNRVRANGKSALTVFRRIAYYPPAQIDPVDLTQATASGDGTNPKLRGKGYSIVSARPLTGRTHQIRVHLQYLGHPIANDPIYANIRVFGPELGRLCSSSGPDDPNSDESVMARLSRMGKDEVADAVAWHDEQVDDYNRRKAEKLTGEKCETCGTELYSDPGPQEMGIWLHAKRYEDADGRWAYETGLPRWALSPDEVAGLKDEAEEVVIREARGVGDLIKVAEEEEQQKKNDQVALKDSKEKNDKEPIEDDGKEALQQDKHASVRTTSEGVTESLNGLSVQEQAAGEIVR